MKAPQESFNIITRLKPGPGVSQRSRVSPLRKTMKEANAEFGPMVKDAITNREVLEIRLCRHTGSRTEVVSVWTRAQLDMLAKDVAA